MKRATQSTSVVLVVTALCLAGASPSSAATAYAAGFKQAHKRGLANAACYASVFEAYASLNRNGHWVVRRSGSRDNIFQLEVYSKCGISG